MSAMHRIRDKIVKDSLNRRLLFWVWVWSSVIALVFIGFQLLTEYRKEKVNALSKIASINRNYAPSLASSIWEFNEKLQSLQLSGILNMKYICQVTLTTDQHSITKSSCESTNKQSLHYQQIHLKHEGMKVGLLKIGIDIRSIKKTYLTKTLKVLLTEAVKTFLVSFLLFLVFKNTIMVHLLEISNYLKTFDLLDDKELKLARSTRSADELELVVSKINDIKLKLNESQKELIDMKNNLEIQIIERTGELEDEREKSYHASKLAALGEMAGGIAHEINNPMTIIDGNATIIERALQKPNFDPERLISNVTKIRETVKRVSKIVTGLKNLTRTEGESSLSSANLEDIMNDVTSVSSERIKKAEIEFFYDSTNPCFKENVLCDQVMLSQTIINLILNSYYEVQKLEEKWIKIDGELNGDFIKLSITDSGLGIPKEVREKIFDPFYTSKPIGEGTGLGLSIGAKTLQNIGGSLEVNEKSKNTQFVLNIPLASRVIQSKTAS